MSVAQILRSLQTLQLDPGYQREGGIWTRDRQQLFIDSLLNGFDVPPMYLHRLQPPEFRGDIAASYAVVDGRQRLEAIHGFSENRYSLSSDFRLLEPVEESQPSLDLEASDELAPAAYAGLRLDELHARFPVLAYRFLDYKVPVTIIETDELELIEELFFRLNEGVPLTPAEKRTRGSLIREIVMPMVHDDDVFRAAKFTGRRRNREDLLLRLLFMANEGASLSHVPDLKKRPLDEFATSFRPAFGTSWSANDEAQARNRLQVLVDEVKPVLDAINEIFESSDPLLPTVNVFTVHYLVIREFHVTGQPLPNRDDFVFFSEKLQGLRGAAEDDLSDDELEALEFAQPIQGSTTGSYLARRGSILYRYLTGSLTL